MSNIYLQVTTEKNWHLKTLISKFKKFVTINIHCHSLTNSFDKHLKIFFVKTHNTWSKKVFTHIRIWILLKDLQEKSNYQQNLYIIFVIKSTSVGADRNIHFLSRTLLGLRSYENMINVKNQMFYQLMSFKQYISYQNYRLDPWH